jgi:hypothetical protein
VHGEIDSGTERRRLTRGERGAGRSRIKALVEDSELFDAVKRLGSAGGPREEGEGATAVVEAMSRRKGVGGLKGYRFVKRCGRC